MTATRSSIWIAAARLRTLPAAVVPVLVGTAVAYATHAIAWGPALAALGGALAIQIGTNFANDVFDAERGADGPDRIGPLRAVSAGLISAAAMKRAMIAAFVVASAFGLYLTATVGWPIVAIGVASIIAGIAYTGGPYPLGYHGLGDIFVLAFFGFVAVCGTAFVQLGNVPALAVWAALPVGALATAIIVVNNLRDRPTDARAGKRTLAVRLGRRGAIRRACACRRDHRVRAASRDRICRSARSRALRALAVARVTDHHRATRSASFAPARRRYDGSRVQCLPRRDGAAAAAPWHRVRGRPRDVMMIDAVGYRESAVADSRGVS
jgi:1,4-dihydroxy-2-naphthoate octaprenyltransferase